MEIKGPRRKRENAIAENWTALRSFPRDQMLPIFAPLIPVIARGNPYVIPIAIANAERIRSPVALYADFRRAYRISCVIFSFFLLFRNSPIESRPWWMGRLFLRYMDVMDNRNIAVEVASTLVLHDVGRAIKDSSISPQKAYRSAQSACRTPLGYGNMPTRGARPC